MAGYKTAALAYGPKLFLTFDGDAVDPASNTFSAVPAVILDESGEGNHAILHDSGVVSGYPGHRAAMPSLVNLEPGGQASASFGYYGRRLASPNVYEKAYLEVPSNASSFNFPDNGQFTVMFMLNRANINQYRADNGNISTSRPLIRKTGVFTSRIVYTFGQTPRLEVTDPDGDVLTWNLPNDFHGVDRHLAFVWTAGIFGPDDTRTGSMTIYVDGLRVAQNSKTYPLSLPNTNVNSAIYIGGVPEAPVTHFDDRQTEDCRFDQIAIYAFAMSAQQVARMYRKTLSYRNVILRGSPTNYWECSEDETGTTTTLESTVGGITATVTGGTGLIARGATGPDQVPGARAVAMNSGGQLYFRNGVGTTPIFNLNQNYTIEFWFRCTSTSIASMFSMQASQYPYAGLNATINLGSNNFQSGSIQVQESETEWITATGNWNDGQWHHMAIIKEGAVLSVWIDGSRRAFREVTVRPSGYPGTATMFGTGPGRQAGAGSVSQIAWYTRPLQDQEINARANYRRIYKVRGRVTLRGVPYRANVRFYSHVSGALIQEIFSNQSDGEYLGELHDNRRVDIVVMNSQDPTIRYRVYGPVVPSEYEDAP